MPLGINNKIPQIMHLDLNSCFATAEQQANPLLRNKPVVITAYHSPRGCIIASSIEAKKIGIKVGLRIQQAQEIYPQVVILTPDPEKYRDLHRKFRSLFNNYSPVVIPKSIDEAIIDFNNTPFSNKNLLTVGQEIKNRMKKEIGDFISCNVGIGPNRFLAKLASTLNKPNGLTLINSQNLLSVYQKIKLTDLCGINLRLEKRLNCWGIFTVTDFLNAKLEVLTKQVFQSICGYYWYQRLRGFEVDSANLKRKSFGQSYALARFTSEEKILTTYLLKLTEKMGRRLRRAGLQAKGINFGCQYQDHAFWHQSHLFQEFFYSTKDLYHRILLIFKKQPQRKKITHLFISCFYFSHLKNEQLNLFKDKQRERKLVQVIDQINDRFGEFTLIPAKMMNLQKIAVDRIAFGNVKEL